MSIQTIDLLFVQLARLVLLIKRIAIVPLAGSRDWAILIEGRGFSRLLKKELLIAPNLMRGAGWHLPRPQTFARRTDAQRYLAEMGLGKFL